eukprot:2630163-Rhodomonas_salina.1
MLFHPLLSLSSSLHTHLLHRCVGACVDRIRSETRRQVVVAAAKKPEEKKKKKTRMMGALYHEIRGGFA